MRRGQKIIVDYRPATLNFDTSVLGSEDCLFVNVFAPANAKKLPVLFWIRKCSPLSRGSIPGSQTTDGGGYGLGSAASFEFPYLAQNVGNGFVTVVIQYRLGAFGFLSSSEVADNGIAN